MEMVDKIRIEKDERDADDDSPSDVSKFKAIKWISWKLQFETTLSQVTGLMDNLPLKYVIRSREKPDNFKELQGEEKRFWTVKLRGQ